MKRRGSVGEEAMVEEEEVQDVGEEGSRRCGQRLVRRY